MRIACLCWEFPPHIVGGLGTYAQYITRELVRRGHELTVWTHNPGDLPERDAWRPHRPLRR